MKKKWMSNWGLKLVSVLFAMILWLVVVNVDDPVTTKKFKNIPVTILNEKLITDAGEVYEILENSDRVTITVEAKRSIVESLVVTDFKATADFAERISENSIPIKVEALKRPGDINQIILQNNTVKIAVEKREIKEVPVELQVTGMTADGFTVGKADVEPKVVEVAGPASVVSKIAKVVVPVDVNGASEDIHVNMQGNYQTKSGTVVEDSRIEGDISQIQVNVHLLHTKSIDLNLTTQGEPAGDFRCQDIQYTPTTITIAGEPEDLALINTLEIPPEELNIENARANIVKQIDVTKYLPPNLIVCNQDEKVIQVTLVISALDGKEFKIPMSSVDVLNTPAGMDTTLDYSKTVSVIVKGTSEELSSLSSDDIRVAVDMKGKAVGTYNLQADITVPAGYVVMNKPTVSIVLEASGQGGQTIVVTMQPQTDSPPIVPTLTPTPVNTPTPTPVVTPTPTPVVESEEPTVEPEPSQPAEEAIE